MMEPIPDLRFSIEGVAATPDAVAPQLSFKLRIHCVPEKPIHGVLLRCQIRIEPRQRKYQAGEQEKLRDLFGEPERWQRTLQTMLWTHCQVMVPSFTGSVLLELPVPCTFDFNVAATRYFRALEDGEVPLLLLFSGTIFHEVEQALQVAPIPWEKETHFRLPIRVWKEMMERYYPNSVWLCLPRDLFDRLDSYKQQQGLPTWEQTLERLLPSLEGRP